MSDDDRIPYREGEPPPEGNYIRAKLVNEDGSDGGVWWIKADSLQEGPIRHEDIDELRPMMLWTWRHLTKHLTWCRAYEDWELGFMRDTNPGSQVAYWMRFAYAYSQFIHDHPSVDSAVIFGAVNAIANGAAENVNPRWVAATLQELLENPHPLLADPANFTGDGRLRKAAKHLR